MNSVRLALISRQTNASIVTRDAMFVTRRLKNATSAKKDSDSKMGNVSHVFRAGVTAAIRTSALSVRKAIGSTRASVKHAPTLFTTALSAQMEKSVMSATKMWLSLTEMVNAQIARIIGQSPRVPLHTAHANVLSMSMWQTITSAANVTPFSMGVPTVRELSRNKASQL